MVKYGVTEKQLNREITQEDLAPVAMHFDTVELYLNPLKLNENEQVDVRTSGHVSSSNQIAVINCLSIWRGHKPSEATFRALIRILWDLRKEEIVTNICQYLKKKVFTLNCMRVYSIMLLHAAFQNAHFGACLHTVLVKQFVECVTIIMLFTGP